MKKLKTVIFLGLLGMCLGKSCTPQGVHKRENRMIYFGYSPVDVGLRNEVTNNQYLVMDCLVLRCLFPYFFFFFLQP